MYNSDGTQLVGWHSDQFPYYAIIVHLLSFLIHLSFPLQSSTPNDIFVLLGFSPDPHYSTQYAVKLPRSFCLSKRPFFLLFFFLMNMCDYRNECFYFGRTTYICCTFERIANRMTSQSKKKKKKSEALRNRCRTHIHFHQ